MLHTVWRGDDRLRLFSTGQVVPLEFECTGPCTDGVCE